jgi:phosphoglucosamine mutase
MVKFFGTDGMRGKANISPMTPDIIMKVAAATGNYFKKGCLHPKVVIGKDTRLSGYMIEPALVSGFVSVGMDVMLVGPLPTPAISMLVKSLRADLGVMISASHNPHEDNGIKLFDREGFKLSEQVEREIEARVLNQNGLEGLVSSSELGRVKRLEDAAGRYIEFVKNTFPKNLRLNGLKIVVDCAHGAAYKVAPKVFWELGADIIVIGDQPNGYNINLECGATYVEHLQKEVLHHQADLGIALDGDADRLIIIDEKGNILDGDQLLAVIIKSWVEKQTLQGKCVVGTVMTNLGLEKFINKLGLELVRTPVGDRHVCEYMREHKCNVGGEQSGHIILSDYARTGDGLVAALQILAVLVSEQKRASELAHIFTPIPQVLKNIRFEKEVSFDYPPLQKAIAEAIKKLGKDGYLLVRKSGTEPLIRLMAQGKNKAFLHTILDELILVMHKEGFLQN